MGEPPKHSPKAPPVERRSRPAPKTKKEAAREAIPAAPPPEPRHERPAAPNPASAYEAMMSFANATLRQNIETGARLARCKSPMEALAAQSAHAAAVAQNLITVSLRLMQLGLSPASWAAVQRSGPPGDAR
jgi:hypothetical protein